jgi:chemotaxis protein CheC
MTKQLWYSIIPDAQLEPMLQTAMEHAADGLSGMVGRPISINIPQIEALSIGEIPNFVGNPETETVGVYLLIEGEFTGQVILMLPLTEAYYLADLLLGNSPGTTTELGDLERSALAEAGNLTASYFLNEIATLTHISSRPSPPAVMVDMLGAIVNVMTAPVASVSDALVIAETAFQESGRTILAYFWVLPDPANPD